MTGQGGLQQLPPTNNDMQDIQKQAKCQNRGEKKKKKKYSQTLQGPVRVLGAALHCSWSLLILWLPQTKTLHTNAAKPEGSEPHVEFKF